MNTSTVKPYIFCILFFFNFSIFGMETLPNALVKYIAEGVTGIALYPKDYHRYGDGLEAFSLVNKRINQILRSFFSPPRVNIIDHLSAEHFLKSGEFILWHMFKNRNISYKEQLFPKEIIDSHISFYNGTFGFANKISITLKGYDNDFYATLCMDYEVKIDTESYKNLVAAATQEEKENLAYFRYLIDKQEEKKGKVNAHLTKRLFDILANGLTSEKNNILFLLNFFSDFEFTRKSKFFDLGKLLSKILIKYNEGIGAKAICASFRITKNSCFSFLKKHDFSNFYTIIPLVYDLQGKYPDRHVRSKIAEEKIFIDTLHELVNITKKQYPLQIKNDKLLLNELTKIYKNAMLRSVGLDLRKCHYDFGYTYSSFPVDQLLMLGNQFKYNINIPSENYNPPDKKDTGEKNYISKEQVLSFIKIMKYKKSIDNTVCIMKNLLIVGSIIMGLCVLMSILETALSLSMD